VSDVIMTASAIADLHAFAGQSRDGLETGGIVLGVDEGLGGNLTVRHCGDAGPNALRRPKSFRRDVDHAQQLADAANQHDGSAWIGEWHTHLVDLPTPSSLDLRTYRDLLGDPETQLLRILALILVADDKAGWDQPLLFAWSFTGTVLRQLGIRVETDEKAEDE
jgi:integrative and conjugative element protein (TIGR02256 family)